MIISEYRLSSPKISGSVVFTYHGGVLMSILFRLSKPLNDAQVRTLFADVHYEESTLQKCMTIAGVKIERITPEKKAVVTTQDKIALFCLYYKKHITSAPGEGIAYKVSRADSGMIKSVDVTDHLLTTYFTSNSVLFKNHYSIGNYCKFFNQLRAEAAGATKQNTFPNAWSEKFAAKLSGEKLGQYYKHLTSLGLVVKKSSRGDIIDFVPNGAQQK